MSYLQTDIKTVVAYILGNDQEFDFRSMPLYMPSEDWTEEEEAALVAYPSSWNYMTLPASLLPSLLYSSSISISIAISISIIAILISQRDQFTNATS
ncbi:hypothetical protein BCR34DRAFT_601131 [Clohesyomyces aquaticus]|uniref:Uncharacterized protein n=1 Tax=Clohesyomyces aquaticus TaxID=1231657 RepID=A0A1Y1ZNA4_9PLEO|nr:hypothetical protein BCR34DRAFT_601131 [Clohesyomyces aquaticus]